MATVLAIVTTALAMSDSGGLGARESASLRLGSRGLALASDARLVALRTEMLRAGLDVWIVPPSDPHLSEYVHPYYERRAFISSFTGSAGLAVVTLSEALLWTDGRYFLQAEQQLSTEWRLMRGGRPGVPKVSDWLIKQLPQGAKVGIDPFVHSVDDAEAIERALLSEGRGLSLVPLEGDNLVDLVWQQQLPGLAPRPLPPLGAARAMPLELSGVSREQKLSNLAEVVRVRGADAALVCDLAEVAWLLNLRANDVPFCPVLQAYVLVRAPPLEEGRKVSAILFVTESKINAEVRALLDEAEVAVRPYEDVISYVRFMRDEGQKLMLDTSQVNFALRKAAGDAVVVEASPIALAKARKNAAEIKGIASAHLHDGAALANFFGWLEDAVAQGEALDEVGAAAKLANFRQEQKGFLEPSFPTIAGFGPNGAIIHYNPLLSPQPRQIDNSQMILIDSGGQYESGTTDVTRTLHLGTPSSWERECFTRVLQGHMALAGVTFPNGTPGMAIDAFARSSLWSAGLDYMHGTGHGVGAALNVHEGPQSISPRYTNTVGLREGMVLSIEPGYYEEGAFGIRIENLVVAQKAQLPRECFNGKPFLAFEQLTHVPIQQSLIDPKLLTAAEADWLDAYHTRVWKKISPRLREDSLGRRWLRRATLPFVRHGETVERFGDSASALLNESPIWENTADCGSTGAIFNNGWEWKGNAQLDRYIEAQSNELSDLEGAPKCDPDDVYGISAAETTEGEAPSERRALSGAAEAAATALQPLPHRAAGVGAAQEAAWRAEWRHRLECWWIGLPMPMQTELGSCLAAFGLHLASQLDASWRAAQSLVGGAPAARAPDPSSASPQQRPSEGSCDWLTGGAPQPDLALPDFPQFGAGFEFYLPPIPELLPTWQRLQSLSRAREPLASTAHTERQSVSRQQSAHWAMPVLAGFGGGFLAFGAMLVAPWALIRLRRASRLAAAPTPAALASAFDSETTAGRDANANCVVTFSK